MQVSKVVPYQKWHWMGDEMVYDTIIPASRTVPGTQKARYPIDIREYLSTQSNAVIRRQLHAIVDALPTIEQKNRFIGRARGDFDFRVDQIVRYLGRLKYIPGAGPKKRRFDSWLFPDETLAQGGGDCEDLAFLLAALLQASGISEYNLRVALGMVLLGDPDADGAVSDHAWVVYQNESGAWEILEPLAIVARASRKRGSLLSKTRRSSVAGTTVQYVPHFVFNAQHLWRVRSPDRIAASALAPYLERRGTFWSRFDPSFAIGVHESIYDMALVGMDEEDLSEVKRASFWVDVNTLTYDPRDHFDFAYVPQGWNTVQNRLATGSLSDFGLAIHGIADFYAHTVYAEFANPTNGAIELYDPGAPELARPPEYDFSSCALPGCNLNAGDAAAHWQGQLISGQWWRWYSSFPDDLENSADFKRYRRCLPDHDTMAVDSEKAPSNHRYSATEYQRQFQLRRNAAIAHITQAYGKWKAAHA